MSTEEQEQQQAPPVTPLEVAQHWARRVLDIAAHYERREREEPGFGHIEAHVQGAGRQQHEAAEMAAYMAVVSLAEDLHALVELLHGDVSAVVPPEPPPWAGEAARDE